MYLNIKSKSTSKNAVKKEVKFDFLKTVFFHFCKNWST